MYGPARNPWNLDHTPGGSSGGAAAAVAARILPVAGASDGGGSIRIPAACCGLFGLKAGRGLIPTGPGASEPCHGFITDGVVSRSVRDTAAMIDLLAGPDATSPSLSAVPERPLAEEVGRDPGRLRIGFLTSSAINSALDPESLAAVRDAAALLGSLGHEVEEVGPPHDDAALARTTVTARSSSNKFLQTLDRAVPAELDVHLVLDNASTHKTPVIKRWLLAHPRFVLHFTPTSSSWLNLVERWFGELTTKKTAPRQVQPGFRWRVCNFPTQRRHGPSR